MAILRAFASSVGKKQLVAITGLLLTGFLLSHLAGNLLLYKGQSAFDSYAKYLEENPLLFIMEAGLLAVFLAHIVISIVATIQNFVARPQRYESRAWHGGRTPGSGTMIFTGLFVLVFLVIHIATFKFGDHGESLFGLVTSKFKSPAYALFYVAAMLAMGLHISHGFQSAFQTLGLQLPQFSRAIKGAGYFLAVMITFGFGSMPIWGLLR